MSLYHVYVRTCHGNNRCYEVAALSEEAAKREASEYGKVTFVQRVCACRG